MDNLSPLTHGVGSWLRGMLHTFVIASAKVLHGLVDSIVIGVFFESRVEKGIGLRQISRKRTESMAMEKKYF